MYNNTSRAGFTLIELMIVVAIIAILTAIAIPAYTGYIKQTKVTALVEHMTNALRVAKAETAKISAGATGLSIITELNAGARKAVGNPYQDAFMAGPLSVAVEGQIAIDGLSSSGVPQSGTAITIAGKPAFGTTPSDYPTSSLAISFTPE